MFVYLNGRRVWVELQAADSGGNDGGGNDLPSDVVKSFERLLERNGGNANNVAMLLFTENKELRDQKRQLEGKVPTVGAIVLSGDEAKTWAAYQALGAPEQVKQGLDERIQLQGKLSAQERDALLRTVAETAGYKASVLANLDRVAKAEGKTLGFELRDTIVDGKTVKAAYVKDGDKDSPLTDYAATNWADFMPSLTAQIAQQQVSGTRYVTQHAGNGGQGSSDVVSKFLSNHEASQAAVKNPLLKGQ